MRTITPDAEAALASGQVQLVQLIYLDFGPGQEIALNSSNWNLTWGGITYLGAHGLGTISVIADAPGEIKGLQFTLSGSPSSSIALALDDADIWQGTPITVRTAVLNSLYKVVDAPIEWIGFGDTMTIDEDGETANISVTAESNAVDLLRGSPQTYSDVDQQTMFPGDKFFEYVAVQSGKPVVWPAKEWFHK